EAPGAIRAVASVGYRYLPAGFGVLADRYQQFQGRVGPVPQPGGAQVQRYARSVTEAVETGLPVGSRRRKVSGPMQVIAGVKTHGCMIVGAHSRTSPSHAQLRLMFQVVH